MQERDVGLVREQAAQPHGRHAEHLRKRAADEQVGDALDFGQRGDAGELVVGLVHQHRGLARAVQDALDAQQRNARAGGVVGIGQQHGARLGRDGVEHLLQRKFHARRRVCDLADLRARHLGVEAVHGVGGLQQQHFLPVVHIGVDEDLDGFVGAVGEDELLGRTRK